MKLNYLPHADKDKVAWLMNFNTIFAGTAPLLGFTAAEIAAVNTDYLAAQYIINTLEIFKNEMHERTKYKELLFDGEIGTELGEMPTLPTLPTAPDAVPAGIFRRIGKIVQRIKNHPKYNDAIGKNLGIIGAERIVDLNIIKPTVSVKAVTADSISLDFVKGAMEGVVVYAGTPIPIVIETGSTPTPEKNNEAEMNWEEIARINHAPFIDTRSNTTNKPETRYYKMRYIKKDNLVGQESDIIRVISTKLKPGADLANKVK